MVEQAYANVHDVQITPATVAGVPARQVTFAGTSRNTDLKFLQVYLIKNDKAYVLSYVASPDEYGNFLGAVQDTIKSLQISA